MQSEAKQPGETSADSFKYILLCLSFVFSVTSIEVFFGQKDFFTVFPFYSLSFLLLLVLYFSKCSIRYAIGAGILARIVLIFIFPGFSDDVFRFYWDGRLIVSGISPYGILPSDVLGMKVPLLNEAIFEKLNSQNYYTIYPPVNQVYFALGAYFGGIKFAVAAMKILVLATELIGLYYLLKTFHRLEINSRYVILYFLNPLVILEGVGNLHFEVVMIALLCTSMYFIFNEKIIKGTCILALSIGVKLLPLMLLPYFFFKMSGKQKNIFFLSLTFFLSIIFLPLWHDLASSSFLDSIDLYFRKFEFNASVYYLWRYLGELISGYNLIKYVGPGLALITILINMVTALKDKTYSIQSFFNYGLLVWTMYLLLATTVHPWYIISLLFFGVLSGFRYPMVWSYLVFISYANYSNVPYFENLWYIALEYVLLTAFILWEFNSEFSLMVNKAFKKVTSL